MTAAAATPCIRMAGLADAAELARLEARCFAEPWSERSLEEILRDTAAHLFVLTAVDAAGEQSPVQAYAGYLLHPEEAEILNIAVFPENRRRGAATRLLNTLLRDAVLHGARRAVLEVREHNLPALGLYQRFSFSPCGRRPHYYDHPREDALILEKILPPQT